MTLFSVYPADANCHYPDGGEKGITIWGPRTSDIYLAPSGQSGHSWTGYFTFTQPKCYQQGTYGGTTACNLTYTISTNGSASTDDVGPVEFYLNGIRQADRFHSKIQNHDITETQDIAMSTDSNDDKILKDTGTDWQNYSITFVNTDANVGVYIKGLTLIRIYQMCGMSTVMADQCGSGDCRGETAFTQQSDFATRVDAPCNYDNCTNLSTSFWDYDDHVKKIDSGETVSWTWTNPADISNNYVSAKSCLFNFNNTVLNSSETPDNIDDVKFSIKVNNSDWVDFYHTKKVGNHMAPSVDLATHSVLSAANGYNDNPGATNVLYFKVPSNNAGVGLALCDGANESACTNSTSVCCPNGSSSNTIGGKVNLYRVYHSLNLYEQKTITVSQTTGGTISPGTTNVWTYHDQGFSITPQSGYRISHVYVDEVDQGSIASYTFSNVTANHTIIAWFVRTYTIYASVGGEGGSINQYGYVTIDEASTPSFTIDAYNCYQIASITIDNNTPIQPGGSHYVYTFDPIYTNHTITATFSLSSQDHKPIFLLSGIDNSITIAVDGTNYTAGSLSNVVACLTANEPHSFYAPPNANAPYAGNCHFYRWELRNSSNQLISYQYCNPMAYNVTEQMYLIANYQSGTASTYSVSPSASSGGTINPNSTLTVVSGNCASFIMKPNSGYHLADLTLNDTSVIGSVSNNQYTINNIDGNKTLYASFSNHYTINASAGSGGSISPSGAVSVTQGSNQAFTITANTGYTIGTVTVDGNSQGAISSYTFTNVTANHTITATFLANYTINASAGANGSISPSGAVPVIQGNNQAFTITPNTGYKISDVTVDSASQGAISSYTFTNIQTNHSIAATFQLRITRVQGNKKAQATTTSSLSATLDSTPTNGNILIAVVGTSAAGSNYSHSSISQTGVTWTKATESFQASFNGYYYSYGRVSIWYGVVSSGASTSVTASFSGSCIAATMDICEYNELATSGLLDKTATSSGSSSTTSTGTTATTSQDIELWIGGIVTGIQFSGSHSNATNSFTLLDGSASYASVAYLERIVLATGTAYSGTTGYYAYAGCIATFKAAS